MQVTNLPIFLDEKMYANAINTFLEKYSSYIESFYTMGNITFPGISDIDLIVIPKKGILSPLKLEINSNMPACYDTIIHHNPFIIPEKNLEVIKYASFSNLQLYYGNNLLKDFETDNSETNKYCIALEGLISYWNVYNRIKSNNYINATYYVPIFSSFRFTLKILSDLKVISDLKYDMTFDELRMRFHNNKSSDIVLEMFIVFEKILLEVTEKVFVSIDINVKTKKDLLNIYTGNHSNNKVLNLEKANERYQSIQRYMDSLVELNYAYGTIFRTEVYETNTISLHYRLLRKIYLKLF